MRRCDAWRAREFVSRVQQLRKKAKLLVTDVVNVYYACESAEVAASVARKAETVSLTVRGLWAPADQQPADAVLIAEEEATIEETKVVLRFTKP